MFHRKQHNNTLASSAELPASGVLGGSNTFSQQNTVVAAPIVQETIRNDRVIEVQPVVHRSVDRNVVHHIEKHITETGAPNMGGVIERPPLVQDAVHTNVVNEIQPVIHRERVVPVVQRAEQHFTEHVSGGTVHTHEVVYENGGSRGLDASGFGLNNSSGFIQQQQSFQQVAQPMIGQGSYTQQPIGMAYTTQAVPLYPAPMMGTPYGSSSTVAGAPLGAKTGKRHHHGVLHRNAKQ